MGTIRDISVSFSKNMLGAVRRSIRQESGGRDNEKGLQECLPKPARRETHTSIDCQKTAATHSLFRVVQVVTGGEVWRGGVGSRCSTPAKGQNFPEAFRYLF